MSSLWFPRKFQNNFWIKEQDVNIFFMLNLFKQDARGDQCDACGKLLNATELKVYCISFVNSVIHNTKGVDLLI